MKFRKQTDIVQQMVQEFMEYDIQRLQTERECFLGTKEAFLLERDGFISDLFESLEHTVALDFVPALFE